MEHTDSRGNDHVGLMYEDFTEGLVWPKLIRAGGLALRPERIGLGVAIVLLIGMIERIGSLWHDTESSGDFEGLGTSVFNSVGASLSQIATSVLYNPGSIIGALINGIGELAAVPMSTVQNYPLSVFVLGIPMVLVWAVLGGAISRSAMCEVSLAKVPGWPQVLGSAMRRWLSLLGAMLVPLLTIAGCWFLIAVLGLGLHVPVLGVLSAVLFGLGVVLGLIATLVLLAYVVGGWMLVPAVMAEGTDALDGVQRSLAYVWSRPLRSVLYLVILTAVGFIAVQIAAMIGEFSVGFATEATQFWGPNDFYTIQGGVPTEEAGIAGKIVAFWGTLIGVLIAGYGVSYIHTAGAMQYLCLRRVCDGQEFGELWDDLD